MLKPIGYILLAAVLLPLLAFGAAVLFLRLWPSVGKVPDRRTQRTLDGRSRHHYGGRFHNEPEISPLTGQRSVPSDRRRPARTLPAQTPSFSPAPAAEALTFTWLGHSSVLLQIGGKNVLIDPVLSERCSPVSFAGPRRFARLPLTREALPRIDAVFLSHDHYDHIDYPTIRAIQDRVGVFVVPLGLDVLLRGWGIPAARIRSLDWWESARLEGITFTLTPTQHFSGRNPLHRNSTLWGGLYVQGSDHRVYYTGDGGYCGVFHDVFERLGPPELMLAECGQYDPAWAKVHMFPEQTVQAGLDAGAAWVVPVHWGSFCICNHAWDDSIRRVTAAAQAAGLSLATPRIGQTVPFDRIAACSVRWWESCI